MVAVVAAVVGAAVVGAAVVVAAVFAAAVGAAVVGAAIICFVYSAFMVAVLVLRRTRAQARRPFRTPVWQALRAVPSGQTRSYGEIAHAVDYAPRAVGGACGANPIAIIVPCHRIVGAGGWIGGFSGGDGCATKNILLEHETPERRLAL